MKPANHARDFGQQVARQARRLEKQRRHQTEPLWQGLANSGVVGWSITLPTLGGIFAGLYADGHFPGRFSYTLMGLACGLIVGCLHATWWLSRQHRNIGNGDDADVGH